MDDKQRRRIHPLWWTAVLFTTVVALVAACLMVFMGAFRRFVPVTLLADRTGLVMEVGAKVKLFDVEVGRVGSSAGGKDATSLKLEIEPDQIGHIPANVQAEIKATTVFGAKYVALTYPDHPSPKQLAAGAILRARNVSTEVNTVFENVVNLLNHIDVFKLNSTLNALADGLGGQGERIGEAITDANQVLLAINPRMDTVANDWRSFNAFNKAYGAAAQDILAALNAASTTSVNITDHAQDLDTLLLNAIGLSNSALSLLSPDYVKDLVQSVNGLEPTTKLLMKYNPELTCTLVGAKIYVDEAYKTIGGNGRTLVSDSALLFGGDPYKFPENLPIVGARGGPGGKPGCGSLPDITKNLPAPFLVTDTGWGTGMDVRPNPGIGFPGWTNYFPVTRGQPEPPKIANIQGGPAPGPIPYPGAPPYGAPLYAPDGTPQYPGLPSALPPGAPREPGPRPGQEPFIVPSPASVPPTPLPPPPPGPEGYQPSP